MEELDEAWGCAVSLEAGARSRSWPQRAQCLGWAAALVRSWATCSSVTLARWCVEAEAWSAWDGRGSAALSLVVAVAARGSGSAEAEREIAGIVKEGPGVILEPNANQSSDEHDAAKMRGLVHSLASPPGYGV
jgi:hypothetical protein